MKMQTKYYLIKIASLCFHVFPMFWMLHAFPMLKIAGDEILHKRSGGTAHLRTLRGSIGYKKCTLLAAMLLFD